MTIIQNDQGDWNFEEWLYKNLRPAKILKFVGFNKI